jgi:hypothetical protein
MRPFELIQETHQGIPVFRVRGYYEREVGLNVLEAAEVLFQQGKKVLILDLEGCAALTSPGISTIVELAVDMSDRYDSRLIVSGANKLQEKVLSLVGLPTMAEMAPSLEEALKQAGEAR